MLDTLITGGLVVDGTGAPPVAADVGILAGRIVAVGDVDDVAARTIEAGGRVVCPGFIDVHTHIDAQAFWDPSLGPSPLHGVTTAFAGNCGFSIAPLSAESGSYLLPMLARVEGMPLASLAEGVPWDWASTAEYLERLDGTLAINTGFMVGHSALRRLVMGEEANQRTATPGETARMCALLRQGLRAGGIGFSTTTSTTHTDATGTPVPSRFAGRDEMVALAAVCREFPGTSLELLPRGATDPQGFDEDVVELMIDMSLAAARPLNWNVITPTARNLDQVEAKLAASDLAEARGAKIVGLTMPVDMRARFSFHAGFVLDGFDGWAPVLALPVPARLAALADPSTRAELEAGAARTANLAHLARWDAMVIVETFTTATARYEGMKVGDIASGTGRSPFDTLLDIACADGLRTTFSRDTRPPSAADWQARLGNWRDRRTLVGASDAGAHLDMMATFRYSTGLLQEAVREQQLLPIEEAIHLLTGAPARLYGVEGRGVLAEGAHADVVVLDPDEVGSGPVGTRFDLPGGAGRLYADATGIDHVLVAGVEIASQGKDVGARPGRVLRSGTDTVTPTMAL